MNNEDLTRWNKFGKLKTENDLEAYFKKRNSYANSSRNFYHYTSLDSIDKIVTIDDPHFRLKSVKNQNDRIEHGSADERTFTLCFSSGIHENLSLWLLYADKGKKGGRLRFTGTMLKGLLNSQYFYAWLNEAEKKEYHNTHLKDSDFDLKELTEVLYLRKSNDKNDDNDSYFLKYNTMCNYSFNGDEAKKYMSAHEYSHKDIIWYYEKETRLVIQLKEEFLKNHKPPEPLQPIINVKLSNEIFKNMKLDLAPGISFDEVLEDKNNYGNIQKRFTAISDSQYLNRIKIDLCRDCDREQNNTSTKNTEEENGK